MAIGIVMVTATISLVVSATMEMIATMFRLRSKNLEQGIARMLDEKLGGSSSPIAHAVYNHPMILALSSPEAAKSGKKPSYIDAITFTTAFLDTSILGATLVAKIVDTKDTNDATITALARDLATTNPAAASVLTEAWAQSGSTATVLVQTLQDKPGGGDALVAWLGKPEGVAARIADLEAVKDPTAPQLRAEWAESDSDVKVFLRRLETPPLITHFNEDLNAVQSAINKIKATQPFLGRILDQLWTGAGGDPRRFRHEIEDWYDREMQRVSGWYSRRSKWIMIAIGMAIAIALNASLTTIGRSLWTDSTLRSNVVAEATAIVRQAQQTTTTTTAGPATTVATGPAATTVTSAPAGAGATAPATTTIAHGAPSGCVLTGTGSGGALGSSAAGTSILAGSNCLQSVALPIGWNSTAWPGLQWYLLLHLIGIVMVGVATSFGAPFWFGVLGNLVNLRGSGAQPPPAATQRAPAEAPAPTRPVAS